MQTTTTTPAAELIVTEHFTARVERNSFGWYAWVDDVAHPCHGFQVRASLREYAVDLLVEKIAELTERQHEPRECRWCLQTVTGIHSCDGDEMI